MRADNYDPGQPTSPLVKARRRSSSTNGLLDALLQDHPAAAIRAALLSDFIRQAGLLGPALRHAKSVDAVVSASSRAAQAPILRALSGGLPIRDLKHLESILESIMDPKERREQGSVYTPTYIIQYLVREGLAMMGARGAKLPKVLDPACGAGGFLVEACPIISQATGTTLREVVEQSIHGTDLDPAATQLAAAMLELTLLVAGESVRSLALNLFAADALLTPPRDLCATLGAPDGFQLVTTNPPYVKLQNLDAEYRARLLRRFPEFASGSFSSALLFIITMHQMLASDGCAAMITQNNIFTSLAGQQVRAYIQDHRALRRLIDFNHNRVFPGASAYTCLLFLRPQHTPEFEYACVREEVSASVLQSQKFSTLDQTALNSTKWRLAEPHHLRNLDRIQRTGQPLGQAFSIRVGFATLKDRAFFAEKHGDDCEATLPSGERTCIELKATRPAIRIADFDDELGLAGNRRRIVFPYRKVGTRYQLIAEDELAARFPKTYAYLSQWRSALDGRDKGNGTHAAWYAWGRTQGMEAPGPKLLTKTFDRRPNFMLDETDSLFCNGYAVFTGGGGLFPEHTAAVTLRCLLNSEVMHYYAVLTSFQIEGGYQCYQKNFIETFGIPDLSEAEARRIVAAPPDAQQRVIAKIYGIKPRDIHEIIAPAQPPRTARRAGRSGQR